MIQFFCSAEKAATTEQWITWKQQVIHWKTYRTIVQIYIYARRSSKKASASKKKERYNICHWMISCHFTDPLTGIILMLMKITAYAFLYYYLFHFYVHVMLWINNHLVKSHHWRSHLIFLASQAGNIINLRRETSLNTISPLISTHKNSR